MSLDDLVVGEATGLKFVFSAGPQIDSHEPSFLCFINSLIYNHLQSAIRRIQKSLANESVNIGDRNHTCPKNQDRIRLYSITQLCVVFCLFFLSPTKGSLTKITAKIMHLPNQLAVLFGHELSRAVATTKKASASAHRNI